MSATNATGGPSRIANGELPYAPGAGDMAETSQINAVPGGALHGTGVMPAVVAAVGLGAATGAAGARPTLATPANSDAESQAAGLDKIQLRMGGLGIDASAASFEQIAQVLIESNKRNREASRLERQVHRDMDISAQKQAADDIRTQSWFSLAASMVSSGFGIVGATMQIKASAKTLGEIQKAETAWLDAPTKRAVAAETATLEEAGTKIAELNTTIAHEAVELPVKTQKVAELKASLETERAALKTEQGGNLSAANDKISGLKEKIARLETELHGAEGDLHGLSQSHAQNKVDVAAKEEALHNQRDEYAVKNRRLADEGYHRESHDIQANSQSAQAYGSLVTEIGKVVGALLNWKASNIEGDKAEHMAVSTKARSAAEDETDYMRAYMDMMRSAMDKLSAMQQAESDTSRSIVRA